MLHWPLLALQGSLVAWQQAGEHLPIWQASPGAHSLSAAQACPAPKTPLPWEDTQATPLGKTSHQFPGSQELKGLRGSQLSVGRLVIGTLQVSGGCPPPLDVVVVVVVPLEEPPVPVEVLVEPPTLDSSASSQAGITNRAPPQKATATARYRTVVMA